MGLQAETPAWMRKTISNGRRRIGFALRSIHRLQEKMIEGKIDERRRIEAFLWKDKLELIARGRGDFGAGFRTDADPVELGQGRNRAVGLDRAFEPDVMQRADQGRVELQKRF